MAEQMIEAEVQAMSVRSLPLFITPENKYPLGWTMFAFAVLLYLVSNHFHIFPPQLLPFSWVDNVTPFSPLSVWIYFSEYVFFAMIYVLCKDMTNLNKFFYSFVTLQSVSVLIFFLWPTTYPRHLFPLPDNLDFVTRAAFTSLRQTDTPANCCPSLHVSSVFLSSFIYLNERKKLFPFIFAWATIISISTLTTKQHYFVDVVSGFLIACVVYWIFHRVMTYYKKEV